jgi:hypothetical protein
VLARPLLPQDVIQFKPLMLTMGKQVVQVRLRVRANVHACAAPASGDAARPVP